MSVSSVPSFSVLDLSPIIAGSDAAESFRCTLDLARHAERLFTSVQQQFANALRGEPAELPPPVDDVGTVVSPLEMAAVAPRLHYAVVGARDRVERGLRAFLAATHADELLVTGHIYDHAARLRSFEIVSEVRAALGESDPVMAID